MHMYIHIFPHPLSAFSTALFSNILLSIIFGIADSHQSLDIAQNSGRGISDFRISAQSFINNNCHNSRSSPEIDMKLDLDQ